MSKLHSLAFLLFLIKHATCQSQEAENPPRPNIVLILADDLGYGDLASAGHPTSLTPNLDKLAASSRVFTDFYTASPVCSPSRAALLTGLYQVSTGIWPGVFFPDDVGGLDPGRFDTLATLLKQRAGYRTAHVGKWHLGVGEEGEYLPTKQGFDSYLGIPYSHDMCPCQVCFPGEKCQIPCNSKYVSCPLLDGTKVVEQPVGLTRLTKRYTRRAAAVIREGARSGEPFFLYLAYHHTHHPQFAGRKFRNSTLRGAFGDALAEMDHSIGSVLSALHRTGLQNNTLVFFASDNGPSLGRGVEGGCAGALRCGKGTTWEGGVRVPAMAHWPGRVRPGRAHGLLASIDLVPTLMALLNVSVTGLHGRDQLSLLVGTEEAAREDYVYFPENPQREIGPYAVRYKNYKAHFFTKGAHLSDDLNPDHACRSSSKLTKQDPPVLFDLASDPGERHPLDPEMHEQVLGEALRVREEAVRGIAWADSEVNRGKSKSGEICCNRSDTCQPFPECCDCHRTGRRRQEGRRTLNNVEEMSAGCTNK